MAVVQIYFNKEEFEDLLDRMELSEYRSAADFIRSQLFPQKGFVRNMQLLKQRALDAAPGTYTVSKLIGSEFVNMPVGIRKAIGRAWYRAVLAGEVPHFSCTGENSYGSQTYVKQQGGN